MQLPSRQSIRRQISKLTAKTNRTWYNGCQPVSGLFTLVGKAEQLERGHKFRATVARVLRWYRAL